jgi:membrane protease YdiL (CAAX protease family)
MKKYVYVLIFYIITIVFYALFYRVISQSYTGEFIPIVGKSIFILLFLYLIVRFVKDKKRLFGLYVITKGHAFLTIILLFLFAINNYFMSIYPTNIYQEKEKGVFWIIILSFVVNSFYEELMYRGVIQNYINQNTKIKKIPISKGNLFASILMFLTHLGFFTVMSPLFAITSLLLVFVFSLIMGVMRDEGMNIWLLIVIHTLVNTVHVLLNINHYIN